MIRFDGTSVPAPNDAIPITGSRNMIRASLDLFIVWLLVG